MTYRFVGCYVDMLYSYFPNCFRSFRFLNFPVALYLPVSFCIPHTLRNLKGKIIENFTRKA